MANGDTRKYYTPRVATSGGDDPNLLGMEHTAQPPSGVAATLLRGLLPKQRRPILRFTFQVIPQAEAPFELEIWSEDLGDAADRAFALAAMAYGPETTVRLVADRYPDPVI